MTSRWVALLRGVNVGGRRKIVMAELRSALTEAGAGDVKTYLASGNVAFDTDLPEAELGPFVSGVIAEALGVADVTVMVRSPEALRAVVADNPFPVGDPPTVHVMFLEHPSDSAAYEALDLRAHEPEQLAVGGAHIWLSLPGGVGRSALVQDLPRLLRAAGDHRATGTMRNWRTVAALGSL